MEGLREVAAMPVSSNDALNKTPVAAKSGRVNSLGRSVTRKGSAESMGGFAVLLGISSIVALVGFSLLMKYVSDKTQMVIGHGPFGEAIVLHGNFAANPALKTAGAVLLGIGGAGMIGAGIGMYRNR